MSGVIREVGKDNEGAAKASALSLLAAVGKKKRDDRGLESMLLYTSFSFPWLLSLPGSLGHIGAHHAPFLKISGSGG